MLSRSVCVRDRRRKISGSIVGKTFVRFWERLQMCVIGMIVEIAEREAVACNWHHSL